LFPASEQRFLGKAGEMLCALAGVGAFAYLIAQIALYLVGPHAVQ
jgi:hypothetical protein